MKLRNMFVGAALALTPSIAAACGGFFCSAEPVDQEAERIIFVQEDSNTVSAYVEIMYQGEPEGFAWVVPVPDVPELETWNGAAFKALDLATQPTFETPWNCFLEEQAAGGDPNSPPADRDDDGVDVLAEERVGPFDTVTIQSEDSRALVDWLRENGYRIVPEMEPFIALYTAEGMKFTAMKLAPGEGVDAITPIKMTYRSMGFAVPLRLTAVAAQLEMGVKVWILGDGRYGPVNVPELEVDDSDLVFDIRSGRVNYGPLIARTVDAAGGRGFVTELATPTEELARTVRESFVPDRVGQEGIDARDALADLLESKPYLTRLYTRVSPEEMDIDPVFMANDGGDVSNHHVVPEAEGQDECGGFEPQDAAEAACDFAACGQGGTCAAVALGDQGQNTVAGCACAPGTVARARVESGVGIAVGCADSRLNFAGIAANPEIEFPNVCANSPCGDNGQCKVHNGFPSCACDAGFVAIAQNRDGALVPTCAAPISPMVEELEPPPEPNLPYPGRTTAMPSNPNNGLNPPPDRGGAVVASDDGGCAAADGPSAWWLFLLPVFIRRRRQA